MANAANLVIRVTSDVSQAQAGLGQMAGTTSKFERGAAKANKAALLVAAGLGAIGVASFKQASDLQQAAGAVDSVFGKQAKAVHELAKSAADSFGLSRSEYSQTAAVFGAQLKNMGVAANDLVPTTDKLVGLGADLAATFGGSTSEAVDALGSLMRGERDPIEKYGVSIKAADVAARLAAKGQNKLTGEAKRAAETEATLAILYEQTAAAQGQRAREANTAAARQEQAMAKLKNAGAALGAVLLPVVAALALHMADLAGFVENNSTAFVILAGVLGTAAAAVYAVNLALKVYRATVVAVAAAQKAWNLAMAANPLGLIVVAVIAAVAAVVLLYRHSSRFRALVQAVGRAGKTAIGWLVSALQTAYTWIASKLPAAFARAKAIGVAAFLAYTWPTRLVISLVVSLVKWIASKLPAAFARAKAIGVAAFNAIVAPIRAAVGWVESLINKLRSIHWPSPPGWLSKAGGAIGLSVAPTSAGAAYATVRAPGLARGPAAYTTARVGGSSAGGSVVINVTGALDPVAVGNQIAEILRRRNLRLGVST